MAHQATRRGDSETQISRAELQRRHEAGIQRRETLAAKKLEKSQNAEIDKIQAEENFKKYPTKKNYRIFATAIRRAL